MCRHLTSWFIVYILMSLLTAVTLLDAFLTFFVDRWQTSSKTMLFISHTTHLKLLNRSMTALLTPYLTPFTCIAYITCACLSHYSQSSQSYVTLDRTLHRPAVISLLPLQYLSRYYRNKGHTLRLPRLNKPPGHLWSYHPLGSPFKFRHPRKPLLRLGVR